MVEIQHADDWMIFSFESKINSFVRAAIVFFCWFIIPPMEESPIG
jgi:hypothetical protein